MAGDQEKPRRILGRSQEVWDALIACGLVHKGDYVRRVVIDIDVRSAVTVYTERYADTWMLDVLLPVLGGRVEIRGVPKPPPSQADESIITGIEQG